MREIEDRIVIVVEDGLATGATMPGGVPSVREGQPARLVAAVPVGSSQARAALREEADEVVCLDEPVPIWAVGRYCKHFEPTEGNEVRRIMQQANTLRQQPMERFG